MFPARRSRKRPGWARCAGEGGHSCRVHARAPSGEQARGVECSGLTEVAAPARRCGQQVWPEVSGQRGWFGDDENTVHYG